MKRKMNKKRKKISEEEAQRQKEIEEDNLREKRNLEKYRINYLSFKTSLPKTKLKSFCPKCSKIPDIYLKQNSETDHYVKCLQCRYCYCCSHPFSKTLDDYISIMVKIQQDNIKCDVHKEKGIEEEGYFSCEYCQKWMCEECINKHIQENENHELYLLRKVLDNNYYTHCPRHNLEYKGYITEHYIIGYHYCEKCSPDYINNDETIIEISKEKGECYLNQLKEIIKEGVEYLDKYCKNLYNLLIKSIDKNQELLKKAKEIYDKFLIRNRRALFYYQMVVNTATPSYTNYNLIINMSYLLLTKFEKIDISLSKKNLNKEEINKIILFFENNYIVGKEEKKIKDLKEFNLKEINTFKEVKKQSKKKQKKKKKKKIKVTKKNKENEKDDEDEEKDEQEEEKKKYVGIILLNKNIICACSEDGYIHIFNLENSNLNGKFILSKKAHEQIISLDNIKNSTNKFVTCDKNVFKIWKLDKNNNNYIIECETILKNVSDSNLKYLYVLNFSNSISFINENDYVIILNNYYKQFFQLYFENNIVNALYQIESKDENNGKFIIGSDEYIVLYKIIGKIDYLGCIKCGCFYGKSLFYWENDILIVGDRDNIYLINIKNIKLEYIIKFGKSEGCCFLKFNDIILCGYGDTRKCYIWINDIASSKETKFGVIKKNKGKYESFLISDEFYEFGIADALWIDKNKFISYFYDDDSLKIYEIK